MKKAHVFGAVTFALLMSVSVATASGGQVAAQEERSRPLTLGTRDTQDQVVAPAVWQVDRHIQYQPPRTDQQSVGNTFTRRLVEGGAAFVGGGLGTVFGFLIGGPPGAALGGITGTAAALTIVDHLLPPSYPRAQKP